RTIGGIPPATLVGAFNLRIAALIGAAAWIGIPLLMRRFLRATPIAPSADPTTDFSRLQIFGIAFALALGALLRAFHATESLWYDEISAAVSFMQNGVGPILGNWFMPTNHVPQTLLSWLSVQALGGFNEFSLRFPLIVIGTIGIWFAAKLGREVATPRAGVLCAFAMALCPIAVLEGSEARGYAIVITLSTALLYYAMRLSKVPSLCTALALALCAAVSAWAHPVSGFLTIGLAVATCIWWWRGEAIHRAPILLLACILGGVTACVLLSPLSGDFLATRATYLQTTADQPTLRSLEGVAMLKSIGGDWFDDFMFTTIITLALAWFAFRRVRFMLVACVLGVVLALVASMTTGTWIYARFLVFFVPATVLCVGVGADKLLSFGGSARNAGACVLLLLFLPWFARPFNLPSKQPIREAVEYVSQQRTVATRPLSILSVGLPDDAIGFYALTKSIPCRSAGILGSDLARVLAEMKPEEYPTHVIVLYPNRARANVIAAIYPDKADTLTQTFNGWADWGQGDVVVWTLTDP
ncbi:MAG: hypothetical protein EXS10_10310, partial [Phycisphaerales bacterium]|nr:hypothetical protein [Phycisphaerales bacterium]